MPVSEDEKPAPVQRAINNQLSGYYSSLADSETVLGGTQDKWLDISPFVSFMMDAFEHCLIDAALADNALTEAEKKLLERMNHAGIHAEITTKKAAGILQMSDSGTRAVLKGVSDGGEGRHSLRLPAPSAYSGIRKELAAILRRQAYTFVLRFYTKMAWGYRHFCDSAQTTVRLLPETYWPHEHNAP